VLRLGRAPIGGLKNEATIDHSGNTVVKALPLSLDSWETLRLAAIYTTLQKCVVAFTASFDI
jgi:hypothetical protein